MTARSCPSCGLDVAPHQTLCPSCRTPVPSEAGPVASSAEGTGIVVGAPPPRRALGDPAPPPAGTDPPADDVEVPPAVAEVRPEHTALDLAPSPFAPPAHGAAPGASPAPPPPTPIPPPPPAVPPPAAIAAPPVTSVPHQAPTWAAPAPAPEPLPTPGPSAGTLGVPGAAVLDERSNVPGGLVALVGAVLVVVGVFLPWMEVGDEAVSGWRSSDDAKVLLALAAAVTIAAALIIGGARSLVLRIGLAVIGLTTVVLGLVDVLSVGDLPGDVSHGPGLVVVLVGGVLVVVAALLTRHRRFR